MLTNLIWFFFQIFGLFWGIKIALKVKPDVIYAHSFASAFPAYLVSLFFKTKLIVRIYGTGNLYWKWNNPWFRLKESRDYLAFKIPADYFVITNDGSHGDLLAKRLSVADKKIKYWRNGIDEGTHEPEPSAKEEICTLLNINYSSKIIVSTCRLIYHYGVDKLFSILVDVFKRESNTICIIAGSGPKQKELENFVHKNNISSKVFFLGIVDREMIKKILNAADIFVLLSRYHNCTNTMWEAMACGKCIVTTETDAIKEVLISGESAILVPGEKMNDLPGILVNLLNNNQLRETLGRNARSRAREVLEPWPKRVEKEAILLEELVKK
ncbi:unnamed protein product [marine sediment metagenome]|uniref:Glycosyl transferase family 1 domain-containing protein n=1 Tax=marine sediment metagenome TaxID=412755 RepID=X0SKM3_9ZZZZ